MAIANIVIISVISIALIISEIDYRYTKRTNRKKIERLENQIKEIKK